jgi:hypothetical protein
MELLIGLAVLVLFDAAAWRWGVSSQPPDDDHRVTVRCRPRRAI